MELVERYIYSVTQQIPEKQRADIERELKSLIQDMLEERAPEREATKSEVEEVLLELGPPHALAAKYGGYERYFIGPSLIKPYFDTLKIVIASILIALTAVLFLDAFVAESKDALDHVVNYFASLFSGTAQGFLWVTVVFAWLQYRQQRNKGGEADIQQKWKPADLPEVPEQRAQIKMSEPIATIFLTVLAIAVCLYAVEWLGVWRFEDGQRVAIPLFDAAAFRSYWPLVWIIGALCILEASVRIFVRKRSSRLLLFHVVVSIATAILSCVILTDAAIWNTGFVEQLVNQEIVTAGSEGNRWLSNVWERITDWAIVVIVVTTFIEIVSEAYHTYRAKTVR